MIQNDILAIAAIVILTRWVKSIKFMPQSQQHDTVLDFVLILVGQAWMTKKEEIGSGLFQSLAQTTETFFTTKRSLLPLLRTSGRTVSGWMKGLSKIWGKDPTSIGREMSMDDVTDRELDIMKKKMSLTNTGAAVTNIEMMEGEVEDSLQSRMHNDVCYEDYSIPRTDMHTWKLDLEQLRKLESALSSSSSRVSSPEINPEREEGVMNIKEDCSLDVEMNRPKTPHPKRLHKVGLDDSNGIKAAELFCDNSLHQSESDLTTDSDSETLFSQEDYPEPGLTTDFHFAQPEVANESDLMNLTNISREPSTYELWPIDEELTVSAETSGSLVCEIDEEETTDEVDLSVDDSQHGEVIPMDPKLSVNNSHPLFFEDTVMSVPETVCQLCQEIENGSMEFPSLSADVDKTNFSQTDYWIALRDFVNGFESTLGEEVEKDHQEALQNSIKRWSSRGSVDNII